MKKRLFLFFIVCFIFIAGIESGFAVTAGEKFKIKAVTHLNSNVSSGKHSPEKLAAIALDKGLDAVFITENFYPRIEYGALPFRGIIKKVEEFSSLFKHGPEEYQQRIDAIDRKITKLDVFMAAEVAPFYFWTGEPYREGLTLNDWDVQFLVFGLEPEEYKNMPTLSSGKFSSFNFIAFLKMWPILMIFVGWVLLKRKFYRFYINNALPWLLIIVGVFYFLYLFPFQHVRYDQYHGRILPGPYQEFIDYVNDNGGMLFWSAPEAQTYRRYGPILFASPKASEHMLSTSGYTGFCVFYEGYRDIGGAGGVWDVVLNEYCWGERQKPVWAIGESAFHDEKSSGGKEIDDVQTIFITQEKSKTQIMDAMKNGSMYAVRRGKNVLLELDDFYLTAPDGEIAFMGEEIISSGPVKISFNIKWDNTQPAKIKAAIIRSGKVIKELEINDPGEIEYNDEYYSPGEKIYYRLDIRDKYPGMLFSNPIFVTFTGKDKK